MTANQIYKKMGVEIPFSNWIGEQKTKYGEKFIENEEFLNMAGVSNFVGDDIPKDPTRVALENVDENVHYEAGTTPMNTPAQQPVKAGLFGGGSTRTILILGGIALLGYYAYKRFR